MPTSGEVIRTRRRAAGLSQAKLAKRLGIQRTYLSKWENDKHGPEEVHANALARELGGEAAEYLRPRVPSRNQLERRLSALEERLDRVEAVTASIRQHLSLEESAPGL